MPSYVIQCDQSFTVDAQGVVSCHGTASVIQTPTMLNDLSATEIGQLSAAVLALFCLAFGIRFLVKQFLNPGRYD